VRLPNRNAARYAYAMNAKASQCYLPREKSLLAFP